LAQAHSPEEGATNKLARWIVAAAVLLAVVVVGVLMFSGGSSYEVNARFINASQLVKGNQVRIAGVPVGSVTGLKLAPNGEADVTLKIDGDHSPLQQGTRAIIRQASLSGIANRYVDLQMPQGQTGGNVPDGALIPTDRTEASVDIDQLFRTFDAPTRKSLQRFFVGSATQFKGTEKQANQGIHYLNPALEQSRTLFDKLTADTVLLNRFVIDSAKLVTTAASRRTDLGQLVGNLSDTTRAIGQDKAALTEVLDRTPNFMRRANTTFVNLRATLDQVDPLVADAKPVAKKLQPFLPQLRSFANGARPTVRDLSRTVRNKGPDNDLVELFRSFPPLADIAVDAAPRNGATRPGAFPQTADALKKAAPQIGFFRPYTPDLMGWFDDFSHSGAYDALGGFSRSQIFFNLFSVSTGGVPVLQSLEARPNDFLATARTSQVRRCPGGADVPAPDRSNVFSAAEQQALDCRESDRAVKP
jgi:phospholipid/cholesterol/gamma-HCH transport system substrate-binding protein